MEMEFNINWAYPTLERAFALFPQTCKLNDSERRSKVNMPSFCAGVYISNLINACYTNRIFYENFEQLIELHTVWWQIAGRKYSMLNYKRVADFWVEQCIISDAMAFPAFCIFKNIRSTLQEIALYSYAETNELRQWSHCSKEVLGDETLARLSNISFEEKRNLIQSSIDNYIIKYNDLLQSSTSNSGEDFYRKLVDCLKTYNNEENDFIDSYLADKNGRCIATFIERDNDHKYIAFSGFFDAEDARILHWKGAYCPDEFVKTAYEICASLGATFVSINLNTKRYIIQNTSPFNIQKGLSIDDLIRGCYNFSHWKKYYSCCERKIFGHFNDNTPNGTLYVKFLLCRECLLGLQYQLNNGHQIMLQEGLMC